MANDKRELKKWTMPEWMEPYRSSFYSTGGNTVEELMDAPNENPHLSQTNAVLFALSMMAEAQVALLTILHRDGKLATAEGIPQADGWVDVADRLPEIRFVADVTVQDEHDANDPPTFDYWIEREVEFRGDHWLIRDDGHRRQNYRYELDEVIAWRERQKPYQRQSREGE